MDNDSVSETNSGINCGIALDNRLSFEEHLKLILNKVKVATKSTFMHYTCVVIIFSIRVYVVCIFYNFFWKLVKQVKLVFLCFQDIKICVIMLKNFAV